MSDGLFGFKSDFVRQFERIEKAEAYAKQLRATGVVGYPTASFVEDIVKTMRMTTYALHGLARDTMVMALTSRDPRDLEIWNELEKKMESSSLDPRILKAYHDELKARKHRR